MGSVMPMSPMEAPRQILPQVERRKDSGVDVSGRTTVMLKNLPKRLSRLMLLELLDKKGFLTTCNFVYLPIEFAKGFCMGYAFVNCEQPAMVAEFWSAFEGLTDWP